MTETEQRIAIAEWCGFKRCPIHLGYECCGNSIPDYLRDLNAIHEAEKKAPLEYWHILWDITGAGGMSIRVQSYRILASATAAQRAEALLRTIGRWHRCEKEQG